VKADWFHVIVISAVCSLQTKRLHQPCAWDPQKLHDHW